MRPIYAGCHSTAWLAPVDVKLSPTTWPRAFIALAPLSCPPGSVPRSTIPPPAVQENACEVVSPVVLDPPTTCPLPFTAMASLNVPPRVPRSTIPPTDVQENAWDAVSPGVLDPPPTWPLALTANGTRSVPHRVGRSTIQPPE